MRRVCAAVFLIEGIYGYFGVAERYFVDIHVGFHRIHVVTSFEQINHRLIDAVRIWHIRHPKMGVQERQLGFELGYSTAELCDFDIGIHDVVPFLGRGSLLLNSLHTGFHENVHIIAPTFAV